MGQCSSGKHAAPLFVEDMAGEKALIRHQGRTSTPMQIFKFLLTVVTIVSLLGCATSVQKPDATSTAMADETLHDKCYRHSDQEPGAGADYSEALSWCSRSAEAGNPESQRLLAHMYYFGLGIEQDYERALHWYKAASNEDDPQAALAVFKMISNGEGTEADPVTAIPYLAKASELGSEKAQTILAGLSGIVFDESVIATPEVDLSVAQEVDAAEVSFEESAETNLGQSDAPAKSSKDVAEALERCGGYRYGEGGYPLDVDKAFSWCVSAAEQGSPVGQSILGALYYSGWGVEQSYRKALYWYTLAANRRMPYAAYKLFYMYFDGQGTEIDRETAFMYLSRSAKLGNKEAQELLATPEDEKIKPPPSEEDVQALLAERGMAKFAPMYPRRAQYGGIEGYVIVDYCVDREGRTTNIRVVDSVPEGLFDEVSIAATKNFRYKPEIVNGVPVERHGVQNKFTFDLEK